MAASACCVSGSSSFPHSTTTTRASSYISSSAVTDPYRTLNIRPGASQSEVKTAFRKLALKYHPDVCREKNCSVRFRQINEAYNIVMRNVRDERMMMEMNESMDDWEEWEEWMGWEGGWNRDYSSPPINL